MSALDLKISIRRLLDRTDDPEVLTLIYALLRKMTTFSQEEPNEVVGYEADGTPITEASLLQSILESSEEVKRGQVISHAAMKDLLGV